MFKIICGCCKKEFESKSSKAKYCSRECVYKSKIIYEDKKCLQCWATFHPWTQEQKYCSHKCLWLAQRNREESICPICWKSFYSTNNKNQIYCSKECYTKSQTTVEEKQCKYCWKTFRWRSNDSVYCSKECHLNYLRNEPLEEKVERLKILWESNNSIISKINLKYKEYLEDLWYKVELEYQINDKFYDLKVWDILIEINPFPYHNSTWAPAQNQWNKPKESTYHYKKLKNARDNWYRCIMVRDWDDFKKITYLLDNNKERIYARNCIVKKIERKDCHQLFEDYHLQWDTKTNKDNIYIWLYYKDMLVECMSFWKPRYNKKYEWEILRLCSHKDYKIVWWANKIFKYFLELTKAKSIISYCDMSKFDWKVYEQLWFELYKWNKPSKHWFNDKEDWPRRHITDNLLRQYWYDWIFWEKYWKWTNNDELMRQRGYVEIYDCWQATFIYNID